MRKRLTRSSRSRLFAGVAGGLAEYWGFSPVLVRTGFVVLSFFYLLGPLVYFILAIFMPRAVEHAERRMGTEEYERHDEGVKRLAAGEPQAAVEALSAAITRDPSFAAAYRRRAEAYAQLGRDAEAQADVRAAYTIEQADRPASGLTGGRGFALGLGIGFISLPVLLFLLIAGSFGVGSLLLGAFPVLGWFLYAIGNLFPLAAAVAAAIYFYREGYRRVVAGALTGLGIFIVAGGVACFAILATGGLL